MRAALVGLVMLCGLGGVHAQYVVAEGIGDAGYPWSRSWVDINGDGRDDFCLIAGANGDQLHCYLSDGEKFGPRLTFTVPGGTQFQSMRWLDINADGRMDLCRTYGPIPASGPIGGPDRGLTCRLAPNFVTAVSVSIPALANGQGGLSDWGHMFTADVNGDGRGDVCYLHNSSNVTLRCYLSNGNGFDAPSGGWISSALDLDGGLVFWAWPRGFFDFNGDGFPDFCRLSSTTAQFTTNPPVMARCRLGSASGFTTTEVISPQISIPYKEGAAFVDVNGDGKTDFCRIVGPAGSYQLSCLLSNGVFWQATQATSPVIPDSQIGDAQNRWWVDVNADGLPDYCRAIPETAGAWSVKCRLSRGDGDGTTAHAFGFSDVGSLLPDLFALGADDGGRSFCDAVGNGVMTYCRLTSNSWAPRNERYSSPIDGTIRDYTVPTGSIGLRAGLVDPVVTPFQFVQARFPLLTAYSDGVGGETQISYLPMTRREVYVRSGDGSYPRAQIVQPRSALVFETRAWRGSAALTGIARYAYKDLRNDTWGGSRGFRERWIFTEGTNTLDHIVKYQGLGPTVDPGSILDDPGEIGLVKYQERYAVANGYLPQPTITPAEPSARVANMKSILSAATPRERVLAASPTSESPFMLLQSTSNTLATLTTPEGRPYRYIGASEILKYDWNGTTMVPLPRTNTSTVLSGHGNVASTTETITGTDGQVWSKNTVNTYGAENVSAWLLGRLTAATVTSTAPNADAQIAAGGVRSAGRSPTAAAMSSATPPAPQPISPAVLAAILQVLLED